MSIRATISGLLAGDSELSDPAAALEEAGYDNIPAEAFGTALTHFSDTATLDEADAVAPVATRSGPIPFKESDLPEIDHGVETDDAFDLFGNTVTTVHQDFGESNLDDLDDLDDLYEQTALDSSVDEADSPDSADETDFDFGGPSSQPEAQDSSDDNGRDEDSPENFEPTPSFGETEPFDAEPDSEPGETPVPQPDEDADDPFDDDLEFDQ